MIRTTLLALALAIPLAASGCGEVEEIVDCQDICTEFENCVGDEYDVSECRMDCRGATDNQIEVCDDCLDEEENICADCGAECLAVGVEMI